MSAGQGDGADWSGEGAELLRICTAGSVDDGKSTLIGRLLVDSAQVPEDQLRAARRPVAGSALPALDLARLTDGLRGERAAGITIDVAYRHFRTARRRFLLADAPGHLQYTRNMVGAASTADAAVVLVDVTRGVQEQTRRHAGIAALLGVRHLVLAVNKMDLVGYREPRFQEVCGEFDAFFPTLPGGQDVTVHALPLSALAGENVTTRSARMTWYTGASLLELLDELPGGPERAAAGPFRMAVQRVVSLPGDPGVAVAGQIAGGSVRPGDTLLLQPAGQLVRVRRLMGFGGDPAVARAPQSILLLLEGLAGGTPEVARGDVLSCAGHPAAVLKRLRAHLVWLGDAPLRPGGDYLVRHMTRTVPATVHVVRRCAWSSGNAQRAQELAGNEAALAELELHAPLAADSYRENRGSGALVLIDPASHDTVAAGMIVADAGWPAAE